MTAGIGNELGRRIKAHGLGIEQSRQESCGCMALDPATGIDQKCKAGRMAFGEAVLAKAFDLLEDLLCELGAIAALGHSFDDALMKWTQTSFATPCSHGAPQAIGFTSGKTSSNHGDLHDLFLKDGHAQCAA